MSWLEEPHTKKLKEATEYAIQEAFEGNFEQAILHLSNTVEDLKSKPSWMDPEASKLNLEDYNALEDSDFTIKEFCGSRPTKILKKLVEMEEYTVEYGDLFIPRSIAHYCDFNKIPLPYGSVREGR